MLNFISVSEEYEERKKMNKMSKLAMLITYCLSSPLSLGIITSIIEQKCKKNIIIDFSFFFYLCFEVRTNLNTEARHLLGFAAQFTNLLTGLIMLSKCTRFFCGITFYIKSLLA